MFKVFDYTNRKHGDEVTLQMRPTLFSDESSTVVCKVVGKWQTPIDKQIGCWEYTLRILGTNTTFGAPDWLVDASEAGRRFFYRDTIEAQFAVKAAAR